MQKVKIISLAVLTTVTFLSCKKNMTTEQMVPKPAEIPSANAENSQHMGEGESSTGHVYTLSNEPSGNKVLDYNRGMDGKLTYLASYATGGNGSGGGLGNQGAIIIANEGENLLCVNPGSNSISLFKIKENGLQLKSTVNSGGIRPVSITQYNDLVYVLNAGGNGNISGFELDDNRLSAINNSAKPLSSTSAGAAEISFVNEGKDLAITEKATNKIITYTINDKGKPGIFHSINSANATPFGFAAGSNGNIFVSEAAGGALNASTVSSYHISANGEITLVTGPVPTNQSAACWVVLSDNEKYAYTTNTGSNTLSAFHTDRTAGLSLAASMAATTGMGPIDAALSNESKFLYVLNSASHSISVYAIGNNGMLTGIQTINGLIAGDNGLAAQ